MENIIITQKQIDKIIEWYKRIQKDNMIYHINDIITNAVQAGCGGTTIAFNADSEEYGLLNIKEELQNLFDESDLQYKIEESTDFSGLCIVVTVDWNLNV